MKLKNLFRSLAATAATTIALLGLSIAATTTAIAAPGDNLVTSALSKLTVQEMGALLSSPMGLAHAAIEGEETSSGPTVDKILVHYLELIERLKGPLRFIAADGSEFDCYGDYVAYQWGGYGLPCD